MALFFLYVAFVGLPQLLRLSWRDNEDPAIELVMLGHEVAVFRRQVARRTFQPTKVLVNGTGCLGSYRLTPTELPVFGTFEREVQMGNVPGPEVSSCAAADWDVAEPVPHSKVR